MAAPDIVMMLHGTMIPVGEPHALGFPDASKWVGTISGACLTNQMINPHTMMVNIRKATSKMVPSTVR